VYWHGSVASRLQNTLAPGPEACLTATLLDGWVLARSAFNHSANYRSVMVFGRPERVTAAADKARLLEVFTERLFPGRWALLRPMTRKELGATTLLSLPLDAASAKVRVGPPDDPERDRAFPVWAGVIPLLTREGRPVAAPDLVAAFPPPPRPRRRRA
jgi:nitroimidazol reductase NimA-like FMN-containing flavoprotein (pyridoxamine 5'-phosphate oxidase superfamily)